MQHQITNTSHLQHLVGQIPIAISFCLLDCFIQSGPLRNAIKTRFAKGNDTGVQIDILRQADEITDIDGDDDLAVLVGVLPDLTIRLALQTYMNHSTGFDALLIGPAR